MKPKKKSIIIIIIMLFDNNNNNNKKKADLMCSDWMEIKDIGLWQNLTDQIVRLSAYKSLCL